MNNRLLIFVLLALFVRGAVAPEVRPAYLELRQTEEETYDVLWKVPAGAKICALDSTWNFRPIART